MGDLSKRLAALSAEKQALLLKRLKESNAGSKLAKIPRQGREQDTFPLSFAQQRRWCLSQLEPERSAYSVWHIIEIKRGVRLPANRETLAELVRRHEMLRTVYPTANGETVQRILRP